MAASTAVVVLTALPAGAGLIHAPVVFTDDAGTGISSSITYTHAVDFGPGAATINGVAFTAAEPVGGSVTGLNLNVITSNPMYGLSVGSMGGETGATGDIATLLTDAVMSFQADTITATLSGLTVNAPYDFRLYYRPWFLNGNRSVTINFNADGIGAAGDQITINEDEPAVATASYLSYAYTPTTTSLVVTFTSNDPSFIKNNWQLYGLSNAVVPVPEPAATGLLGLGSLAILRRASRSRSRCR